MQHVICSHLVNQKSFPTTPVSHSSAVLSSPADQLASPSNECLVSASSSSSSSSPLCIQTSNHSPKLPHSSRQTPSPFHSPAINLPAPSKNHTPSPPCELPVTLAKHSKADENASDHSSSHLLSLLGEDSSSISSVSLPFTPDAVEKPLANSSSVLMKVDKATQEIRVEENLEEEEKLNLLPPVSNGETNKDNDMETSHERNEQEQQLEEDSKSGRKMSQKKDSSSVNESDSDDFWASGSIDDLPLPEENNEKREKQNEAKEEENEERKEAEKEETEEAEMLEEKKETEDKEKLEEEETDEEEMEDVVIQDHISIVQHMLHSLNDRLRKDREEAKYLYMDGSPTDGMKGLIVSSKVLTAVLTRYLLLLTISSFFLTQGQW